MPGCVCAFVGLWAVWVWHVLPMERELRLLEQGSCLTTFSIDWHFLWVGTATQPTQDRHSMRCNCSNRGMKENCPTAFFFSMSTNLISVDPTPVVAPARKQLHAHHQYRCTPNYLWNDQIKCSSFPKYYITTCIHARLYIMKYKKEIFASYILEMDGVSENTR